VKPDKTRLKQYRTRFTEFYWVLPSFVEFCRVLPNFREFFRVAPIVTEFYRVLPCWTELYLVASCFTEFFRWSASKVTFSHECRPRFVFARLSLSLTESVFFSFFLPSFFFFVCVLFCFAVVRLFAASRGVNFAVTGRRWRWRAGGEFSQPLALGSLKQQNKKLPSFTEFFSVSPISLVGSRGRHGMEPQIANSPFRIYGKIGSQYLMGHHATLIGRIASWTESFTELYLVLNPPRMYFTTW